MLRRAILGLGAMLIIVTALALAIRAHRYPDDWRLCSAVGAYHFDYRNEQMIFDDGIVADQAFEMQQCADDISLRYCSISVLDFVNPQRVSEGSVGLEFSVERNDNEVVVTIPLNDGDVETNPTRVIFDKDGSFMGLISEQNGVPLTFKECEFPLFR